jgi:hypothetical protein
MIIKQFKLEEDRFVHIIINIIYKFLDKLMKLFQQLKV